MAVHTRIRVGGEWVSNFPSAGHPCHEDHDLHWADNQVEGFLSQMARDGHDVVFRKGNNQARERDFRHPDYGGESLDWIDNVHFFIVCSHGYNFANKTSVRFSAEADNCETRSDRWRLGTGMLKWIALSSCEGVENTEASHIRATWQPPMQGVHLVLAFIGNSTVGPYTDELGEEVAERIHDGQTISSAWLEEAFGWYIEDYPIVIAAGPTASDAENRLEQETLDWRDRHVTSSAHLAWKYRTSISDDPWAPF